MRLGDRETESPRIRDKIAAQNRLGSCYHFLSSSRSFSLFKGLNGLGLRGVIRRVETNPVIAIIIGTSDTERMIVIDYEGC